MAVIDAMLMARYARKGPDGLGLWPLPSATLLPEGDVGAPGAAR